MNKKTEHSSRKLTRIIFTKFFVAIMLYSVALILSFLAFYTFLRSFTWYDTDLLYRLLSRLNENKTMLIIGLWVLGVLVIFLWYWKKTLGYVDTVVEASNMLVTKDDNFIKLPEELKQIEDRMNKIKQESNRNARLAKEAEQRKNDLIVYLAHDLKTPLTSVIGYLTLLHDEQQISEELREKYLSISLDKAERLEELINEFFEITRFNLSNISLELSRVNLSRMLEQIVFEFMPLFKTKNLQCNLNIQPNTEIKCDINKMERVFDNLIRNAVNYSFENSTINITVISKKDGKKDGIYMYFTNPGNNIPQEKLNRIFEQFYRLDTSRATKTGGSGLGLAISKEIIELHNGEITAISDNEIITFTVHLPLLS